MKKQPAPNINPAVKQFIAAQLAVDIAQEKMQRAFIAWQTALATLEMERAQVTSGQANLFE